MTKYKSFEYDAVLVARLYENLEFLKNFGRVQLIIGDDGVYNIELWNTFNDRNCRFKVSESRDYKSLKELYNGVFDENFRSRLKTQFYDLFQNGRIVEAEYNQYCKDVEGFFNTMGLAPEAVVDMDLIGY